MAARVRRGKIPGGIPAPGEVSVTVLDVGGLLGGGRPVAPAAPSQASDAFDPSVILEPGDGPPCACCGRPLGEDRVACARCKDAGREAILHAADDCILAHSLLHGDDLTGEAPASQLVGPSGAPLRSKPPEDPTTVSRMVRKVGAPDRGPTSFLAINRGNSYVDIDTGATYPREFVIANYDDQEGQAVGALKMIRRIAATALGED